MGFRDLLQLIVTDSVSLESESATVESLVAIEMRCKQSYALSGVYICPDKTRSEW